MGRLVRDIRERLPVVLLSGLVLLAGCQSMHWAPIPHDRPGVAPDLPPTLPSHHSLRIDQFVFLSDFELKREQPIFDELAGLGNQVYRELQLPPGSALIQVYLFEDKERYERFMHFKHPSLPDRRAFFMALPRGVNAGAPDDLVVFTYWSDRVRQDLRHELTHALLHSVLKGVPLWLDEGLAEYFELPPDRNGVNYQHVALLRHNPGETHKPDLVHLEQLSEVKQMNPAEYREAWAWVHLMLRDTPEGKAVLLAYLQKLRTNPDPGPLHPRLAAAVPSLNEELDQHLARLDRRAPTFPY